MKVLYLPLIRHWFDMIHRGEKPEEYRAISEYWIKRLRDRHYDAVCFRNGYGHQVPQFTIELIGITEGFGNPAWGAPVNEKVFILQLGRIVETTINHRRNPMNQDECNHYWIPSSVDKRGNAEFRPFNGALVTHATCQVCNLRTWFTPKQWREFPGTTGPVNHQAKGLS